MARHVLKQAVSIAILSLAAGCTHFTITPGAFAPPPQAATPAAAEPAPEEAPKAAENSPPVAGKALPPLAPEAAPRPQPAAMKPASVDPRCTPQVRMERQGFFFATPGGRKAERVKISVTGYGAPPKEFYPDAQRRLMAMRAAKLDALRSLAERVNGLRIWGGTTIGDMVVEKDRYRVFLDTFIRGAKVMEVSPSEDGAYETVVELTVDRGFLSAVLENPRAQSDPDHDPCLEVGGESSADPGVRAIPAATLSRATPAGADTFYFSQEQ